MRRLFLILPLLAGCSAAAVPESKAPVSTVTTMSFAECQAQGETPGFVDDDGTVYSGGSSAVEYDNGVCTVQD